MQNMNKTIEIMKAAMEKEKVMEENSKESMEQLINEESMQDTLNDENYDEVTQEDSDEADTAEEEKTEAENKNEKSVKSFFKSNKSKEMNAKDQKIEDLTDRLMRTMAEFDNFRKRSEKEKSVMFDMGVRSMIEKLLPIIDNFERGFGTITEKEKESGFAQGIEMIYKQLLTALDEIGLKPIDAVGTEFDPNLHNAVMHGEDDSLGENIVSDEFQKGYIYHDMVVRHSMVKVVN